MSAQVDGKVPPHDLDIEAAVLSAALLDCDACDLALATLSSEHFYSAANGTIWEAVAALRTEGKTVDIALVAQRLRERDVIRRVGGVKYLADVVEKAPAIANVSEYAAIVWSKWQRRTLLRALHTMVAAGYGTDSDEEYLRKVDEALTKCISASSNGSGLRHLREALKDAFERIANGESTIATKTDLFEVDALLDGGARAGELIVVAGRPGSGKTSFTLGWVLSAADMSGGDGMRGYAYVATLEMPDEQCATRMLTTEARVNNRLIRRGQLARDDWDRLTDAAKDVAARDVWINDRATTLAQIASEARQIKRKAVANGSDLAIIAIDYLQIMDLQGGDTLEQSIGATTKALKKLAKELRCPVVILSQLNRGVESRENKRPLMSDVKASGAIEADADIIIGLYRDEYYNPETTEEPGVAEVIVLKNRDGEVGTARVRYEKEHTRFCNLGERSNDTPEAANDYDEYGF